MISFARLTRKSLTAEQEAVTWESSSGWPGHGQSSRDRPMRASEALKISAFYRAVDLRSDSIGRLPVAVKDLNVRREVDGHYLGPVLWEKPNEAMGPFVYKKLVEYQRLVLGNAYVWIYRDRNGRPVSRCVKRRKSLWTSGRWTLCWRAAWNRIFTISGF